MVDTGSEWFVIIRSVVVLANQHKLLSSNNRETKACELNCIASATILQLFSAERDKLFNVFAEIRVKDEIWMQIPGRALVLVQGRMWLTLIHISNCGFIHHR